MLYLYKSAIKKYVTFLFFNDILFILTYIKLLGIDIVEFYIEFCIVGNNRQKQTKNKLP